MKIRMKVFMLSIYVFKRPTQSLDLKAIGNIWKMINLHAGLSMKLNFRKNLRRIGK